MSTVTAKRRDNLFGQPSAASGLEKRRHALRQQQRIKRRDAQAQARRVISSSISASNQIALGDNARFPTSQSASQQSTSKHVVTPNTHAFAPITSQQLEFARQLSIPEWFIEIPSDLFEVGHAETGWGVLPWPVGVRSLLVAESSKSIIRDENGVQLYAGPTELPGGSSSSILGGFTILDGVWDAQHCVFFATDCLSWNGMAFHDTPAALRWQWLISKFAEAAGLHELDDTYTQLPQVIRGSTPSMPNIVYVPRFRCDANGLTKCYSTDFGFPTDGLMFMDNGTTYTTGPDPCCLRYRDSRYSDTLSTLDGIKRISATLQLTPSGVCQTMDHYCVQGIDVSTCVPTSSGISSHNNVVTHVSMHSDNTSSTQLIQCSFQDIASQDDDSQRRVCVIDGQMDGSSLHKAHADTLSKLLFENDFVHDRAIQFLDLLNLARQHSTN